MNRRDFVVRSTVLTAAGLLARPAVFAQAAKGPKGAPAPATPEFKLLRREVGIFTARGGSIGYLVNKDAIAAVDTQFADTAPLFLNGLPGRAGRKLDVLVNSHHHGDHTGGNQVFQPQTKKIVAHANVPALQRAAAERAKSLDKQAYADTTFQTTWRMDLGGETVSAKYHGAAHTSGDIVTHFEKANVIHMGDLGFNRIYPVIDRGSGGRIAGWITVLEAVAKAFSADTIVIFGHAGTKFPAVGKPAELLVLRDYLSAVLDYTKKKIAAGEPKEKIVALENLPGFPDFHTPLPNRLGGNLATAYDELTEKKV
ncbi:MAG: MBL fold metallo-hydrolase [Opitutaceae bacterium]|nr:MBL fold metallo-hydrolase [Opitutaceae bacterium]